MNVADYWNCFVGNHEAIRTVTLFVAAGLGLALALWRTLTSHKQSKTAEKNLINEQFKSGVELLGHKNPTVRLGGISTLSEMAGLYPETLYARVMSLFETFLTYPPEFGSNQENHLKGEVDYGSRDTLEILRIINARNPQQCEEYPFRFPSGVAFVATKNEVKPNEKHPDYEKWKKFAPRAALDILAATLSPMTSQAVVEKRPPEG